MITRGTTPYHQFIIPFKLDDIAQLYITYIQNNQLICEKTLNDLDVEEIDENSIQITVHLTQEDTLSFQFYPAAEKNIAVIQWRVLTVNDEAYASDPITKRIYGILKDGVISND